MASAAAVGANQGRSPLRNDIGEDEGKPGEITSGIYSKDEGLPDIDGNMEDSEEELPSNPLRGHKPSRRLNGDADRDRDEEGAGEDLFGDEDGAPAEQPQKPARRQLDDDELDSGDDVDRMDRIADEPEQEFIAQEKVTMDLELPRQPVPEPSDGEMYFLKVPEFMSIEPKAWDHQTFQPPATEHHSTKPPNETFSAYNTALSTMRWRHSPSDPSQLQSNARINRWADGSLTLQLASDPTTQYEIEANPLAPPQRNPIKPTPVSKSTATNKGGRQGASTILNERQPQAKDAYTYLFRPHVETTTMIITHKMTAGLSIQAAASINDDAIEKLQASLAAHAGGRVNGASGLTLMQTEEDPEAAKSRELEAVRQADKMKKKQQNAIDREATRSDRMLGRQGLSSNRYSGLNVGMLEDEEDGGTGKGPSPRKNRNPRRRRNSEYSEDEDFGRKRFSREDEYDDEDDFLAPSDEEEVVDDDEDPDDGIVEEPRHHRERTPKRERPPAVDDDEADAPGEEEDEEELQMARTKRRRIVDEDEDEE